MTPAFEKQFTNNFRQQGTGSYSGASVARTKVLELDQYEVVLAMTEDDRVLYIVEVREKKDFRNVRQKINSTGHFDLERYINE